MISTLTGIFPMCRRNTDSKATPSTRGSDELVETGAGKNYTVQMFQLMLSHGSIKNGPGSVGNHTLPGTLSSLVWVMIRDKAIKEYWAMLRNSNVCKYIYINTF